MPGKTHPKPQEPIRRLSTDGHKAHLRSSKDISTVPQPPSNPINTQLLGYRPRIWCSVNLACSHMTVQTDREAMQNLKELSDTLPALKHTKNGVSWQRSDIPYLVLDGLPWWKPHWRTETDFGITMCVSLFPGHLTDNLALLHSTYDLPSHGENVPFQSNYFCTPQHHTADNLEDSLTEHAHVWRKCIPDLDSGFIGSEIFYQDLIGMGWCSFLASSLRSFDLHSHPELQLGIVKKPNPPLILGGIKALEDAHQSGKPIAIIASPEYLCDPIRLPPEYAYNFLGLFFLVDIHVSPPGMQPSRSITNLEFSGNRSGLSFRGYQTRYSP